MSKLNIKKEGKVYLLTGLCFNKMYVNIVLTKSDLSQIKKLITKIK